MSTIWQAPCQIFDLVCWVNFISFCFWISLHHMHILNDVHCLITVLCCLSSLYNVIKQDAKRTTYRLAICVKQSRKNSVLMLSQTQRLITQSNTVLLSFFLYNFITLLLSIFQLHRLPQKTLKLPCITIAITLCNTNNWCTSTTRTTVYRNVNELDLHRR